MSMSRKPSSQTDADPRSLRREIEDIFTRLSEVAAAPALGEPGPAVDVYEAQGRFTVVVETPGLEPDSLRVVYRDHQLTITGERRHRRPAGASGCLCLERPNGRFVRSVPLEEALDLPRAEARLVRGLLLIEIPRLKDRRGKENVIPVRREREE